VTPEARVAFARGPERVECQLAPGKRPLHTARSAAVLAVLRQSVIVPIGWGDDGSGIVTGAGSACAGGVTTELPPLCDELQA
jgi:hypothetical protein